MRRRIPAEDLGFRVKPIRLKQDSQSWFGKAKIIVHENGLCGVRSGRGKPDGGVPKQAAEEKAQLREKKSGWGAVYSWGTTKSGRQRSLEEHRLATLGTHKFGPGLGGIRLGLGFRRGCGSRELGELLLQGCQASPPGGAEETIVTKLDEAFGQDMLETTVKELFRCQGTTCFCAGLGGAVAKGDAIIFHLEDPVVAKGDSEEVRGQILQGIQPRPNPFTVHHPRLLPNLGRNRCVTIGVTQRLRQFAPEHPGAGSHRQKEIVSCG